MTTIVCVPIWRRKALDFNSKMASVPLGLGAFAQELPSDERLTANQFASGRFGGADRRPENR
jgi:hypothetical protein